MALKPEWLPLATPLDPAEEPPGSLDPLGTLTPAERLAEELLPAFTVRMWRSRLLTFTSVAALVADRTIALMGGREDLRLEARLAFERLLVFAIVRMHQQDPSGFERARRRLPGGDLARKALLAGQPLTRSNFLKGQAVNGPFGVMAQLGRHLELIDDDARMGRNAPALLMAWAEEEGLPGLLDEEGPATREGSAWMSDAIKATATCVGKRDWPGPNHRIWEQLARHLRPDRIGPSEQRGLLELLYSHRIRRRVSELLQEGLEVYRNALQKGDRGIAERGVLLRALRPRLADDPLDRMIADTITAIDAYEDLAALLQQAFEGLVWTLKHRGGRAEPEAILADARMHRHLERTRSGLARAVPLLGRAMDRLHDQPALSLPRIVEPLARLREDAAVGRDSVVALADTVLRRHERVQRDKGKGPWIERETHWTLVPGDHRVDGEAPPVWEGTYLHPFKIANAYSILTDLGQVTVEDRDAED